MIAPVFGDIRVVAPEVLLAFHAFDRRALLVPDFRYVEEDVGFPSHLLGLVRLEEIKLRRAEHLLARIMTPGLRHHPALQRYLRGVHMVGVVGVVMRMAEHEG